MDVALQGQASTGAVVYPDGDGKRMAENTLQYEWIVTIRENLDGVFRHHAQAFVAADNLIYAVEGKPKVRKAPDVYVAFGRPKGRRGSYKVWEEGGIFPQVVFEVLSPGNRALEMARKLLFYGRYGAEEYYVYDSDTNRLQAYVRVYGTFAELPNPDGWVSPRLGIRFDLSGPVLATYRPNGKRFQTVAELEADRDEEQHLAGEFERLAREAESRAQEAEQRADAERTKNEALRARLRELGLDPDAV